MPTTVLNPTTAHYGAVITVPHSSTPTERLMANTVRISGLIDRITEVGGNHLAVRLRSHRPVYETGQWEDCLVPLILPDGKTTRGKRVSLAEGVFLDVQGYLGNVSYYRTFAELLHQAGRPNSLRPGDETLMVPRTDTYVFVQTATPGKPGEEHEVHNETLISGIVAMNWRLRTSTSAFARLSIYDEYGLMLNEPPAGNGNGHGNSNGNGRPTRPRREAHYVSVVFQDGQTSDGMPVRFDQRQRVNVDGSLGIYNYSEPLANILKKLKRQDRMPTDPIEFEAFNRSRVGTWILYVYGGILNALSLPFRARAQERVN